MRGRLVGYLDTIASDWWHSGLILGVPKKSLIAGWISRVRTSR